MADEQDKLKALTAETLLAMSVEERLALPRFDGKYGQGNIDCTGCLNCTGCLDCTRCAECTHCTDCVTCVTCVRCTCCTECKRCLGCTYCTGCVGCTDCMGLRNAADLRYVAYGVQLSAEQWQRLVGDESGEDRVTTGERGDDAGEAP